MKREGQSAAPVLLLPPPLPPARDLRELFARYAHCHRCPLADSRRHIVPGRGNAEGGIAVVTDRIAGIDEREERLMAGSVGDLLEKILAAPKVEIPRERAYFTATVLCRAPYDRTAGPRETAACARRLRRELALVRPTLVVALGVRAGNALFAGCTSLPKPHQWLTWSPWDRPIPLYITLHPREALWGPEREVRRRKRIIYDDWQAISARFRKLSAPACDDTGEGGVP